MGILLWIILVIILIFNIIWFYLVDKILKISILKYKRIIENIDEENKKKFHFFIKYDLLKINIPLLYLKCYFLFPTRMLLFLTHLIFGYLLLKILVKIYRIRDLSKPQPKSFIYISRSIIYYVLSSNNFFMGFMNIKHETRNKYNELKYNIIVSNHVSWFDIFYYLSTWPVPGFVSNDGVKNIPFIGYYSDILQSFYIDRYSKTSKTDLIDSINDRLLQIKQGKQYNPLLFFSEGTTKTAEYLLKFKDGAFRFNENVKLICLDYKDNEVKPEFVFVNQFTSFLITLLNIKNNLTVIENREIVDHNMFKNSQEYADYCWNLMAEMGEFKKIDNDNIYNNLKELVDYIKKCNYK